MRLVAHRGSSARAPENTLPAFAAALEDGADGVEFDVRLTRDGHPVVAHDDDVSRMTGAQGRISEMTFDDVRALDASGARDGWSDLRIPTLEEVLDLLAGRTSLVVEMKMTHRPDGISGATPVARAVLGAVRGIPDMVLSSFDPAAIAEVRARAPDVPTALTGYRNPEDDWIVAAAVAGGHVECHVPAEQVDAAFVAEAHEAGLRVLSWTVNEPDDVRAFAALGVDGVFTDDPAGARAALG